MIGNYASQTTPKHQFWALNFNITNSLMFYKEIIRSLFISSFFLENEEKNTQTKKRGKIEKKNEEIKSM